MEQPNTVRFEPLARQAEEPSNQPIGNYMISHGMAHANDPARNAAYQQRRTNVLKAQRDRLKAAQQKRHEAILNHTYVDPPRSFMSTDISDQEALNLYYQMAYTGKPLVKAHKSRGEEPLSYAQRKAMNDARKAAFTEELNRVYADPKFKDQRDRELAYIQGRKVARQLQSVSKPKKTKEQIADDRFKRQYRQIYPNAVLMNDKITAALKEFDADDYNEPLNAQWMGMYPQTMAPADREKAARTFAEMTGTLGWMPTYDPKLTTVESAKKIYNPEDYDIKAYDMDMNDFTPANVIIRKKFDIDSQGNYVKLPEPQWKIIAANGYRLPDPSAKQQYARLKTQAYYKSHPTAAARKETSLTNYIKSSVFAPKSKNALASVKNFVKKVICTEFNEYTRGYDNMPYLFVLTRGDKEVGIVFSMSPIAMNSLVSNVARLWCAYELYHVVLGIRESFGNTQPSYLYNIFAKYVQECGDDIPEPELTVEFQTWWMDKHLIQPNLETVLHRDSFIHNALDSIIGNNDNAFDTEHEAKEEFETKIGFYVDLVIKLFMNYYQDSVNQLLAAAGQAKFNPLNDMFEIMVHNGNHGDYLYDVSQGKIQPFPITPMRTIDLPIKYPRLQYWGEEYIEHAQQAARTQGVLSPLDAAHAPELPIAAYPPQPGFLQQQGFPEQPAAAASAPNPFASLLNNTSSSSSSSSINSGN